ncbi:fungal hydrophobin [Trametes cingulata]|nr:fungal hydrophobin [Trametes cingulata]
MFSKLAVFTTLFVALAAATPLPLGDAPKCNTGPIQCCDTPQSASAAQAQGLIGALLAQVLSNGNLNVAANCNSVPIIGATTGTSCRAQPVCCDTIQQGGLGIGCVPVNVL